MQTWREIWEARTLDATASSTLSALIKADGLDTGFGTMPEQPWCNFVADCAHTLGITPSSSVFEVGCGAGAFLYPLAAAGCSVAGSDIAAAQIQHVASAIPQGSWTVQEAIDLDPSIPCDFVIAMGVFLYFPTHDYALEVLRRMAHKATHAIAILDIPDHAKQQAALRFRRGSLGEQQYSARYQGLDHLYFSKQWMQHSLQTLGFTDCILRDQDIEGYGNSAFRFNVFAWKHPRPNTTTETR